MKAGDISVPPRMRPAFLFFFALFLCASVARAEDLTAEELAGRMAAAVEDGDSIARVKMSTSGAQSIQVRIKSHRSAPRAAAFYEILWPEGRKGEGFVLRRSSGGGVMGTFKTASGKETEIGAGDMEQSVLGTALAYADVLENFFRWEKQSLVGREQIGKTECVVLESRPGGAASVYGKVRSWIDPKRSVALQVEKYDKSGKVARSIEATQVAKDDTGRHVPAALSVRSGGKTTEIDGVNIRHDVSHAEDVFAW